MILSELAKELGVTNLGVWNSIEHLGRGREVDPKLMLSDEEAAALRLAFRRKFDVANNVINQQYVDSVDLAEKIKLRKELLTTRMIEAIKTQGCQLSYDPIEYDPKFSKVIEAAQKEAVAAVESRGNVRVLGRCQYIWWEQERILEEKHGITWFSPAQMNPDIMMD